MGSRAGSWGFRKNTVTLDYSRKRQKVSLGEIVLNNRAREDCGAGSVEQVEYSKTGGGGKKRDAQAFPKRV